MCKVPWTITVVERCAMRQCYCSLFRDILLPATERPQLRIPSKLKKSVEDARTAMETRLKDEQKAVSASCFWFFLSVARE